jgi:hypothetical protein
MNWTDALMELPPNDQEILICVDNINFFLGYYDARSKCFRTTTNREFEIGKSEIYWAKLERP